LWLSSLEKRKRQGDLLTAFQYLKGAYKKAGQALFTRVGSDKARDNGFKLKEGRFRLKEEILHNEGGDALAQVGQRSCGCALPGSVQGQVGWGFEKPHLVEGFPAHGSSVRTR